MLVVTSIMYMKATSISSPRVDDNVSEWQYNRRSIGSQMCRILVLNLRSYTDCIELHAEGV